MIAIRPILNTLTAANIVSCTIPEDDYAPWSSTTTYAVGARVIAVTTHRVYEAIAPSTGVNPNDDTALEVPTSWVLRGATNRWRVFDRSVGPQSTLNTTITYELRFDDTVDTVALFNLVGANARVRVRSFSTVLYDEVKSISSGPTRYASLVWFGLPADPGNVITIDVTSGGVFSPAIGEIAFGEAVDMGVTQTGSTTGILSVSRIERDTFGNASITRRRPLDTAEYRLAVPTREAWRIKRFLSLQEGVPIAFVERDPNLGANVYGLFKGFDLALDGPVYSFYTLSVEGMP